MSVRIQTPASLGYRMPAEWEPHAATWLTWPRREGISFPDRFDSVPGYWVKMCEWLSPQEEVHINVRDEKHEAEVRRHLAKSKKIRRGRVFLHRFGCNECWCRDHGPIFVVRDLSVGAATMRRRSIHGSRSPRGSGSHIQRQVLRASKEVAVVDWGYNAWGGKYPPYGRDDAIPQKAAKRLGLPLFSPGIIMEGGALDVNGRGTLLTTESCLLNKNRNPKLTKKQIERYLKDYLGVTNILWLGDGIEGDDTDGHVDDITRFVNPTTVVTAIEEDPKDKNHEPLRENVKRLRTMKLENGKPLRIIELPMPGRVEYDNMRLPASYANFYIANKVVLVPIYSHKNDKRALAILQRCFPTRKVIGIESTDLIWGLGAFHCVTQQQPAV